MKGGGSSGRSWRTVRSVMREGADNNTTTHSISQSVLRFRSSIPLLQNHFRNTTPIIIPPSPIPPLQFHSCMFALRPQLHSPLFLPFIPPTDELLFISSPLSPLYSGIHINSLSPAIQCSSFPCPSRHEGMGAGRS